MSNSTRFSDIFLTKDISLLEDMAGKYPWCSVAQLSLLQHYKKTNSAQSETQATKTALLFNNSNWLNWQLHLLSNENETVEKSEEISGDVTDDEEQNKKIHQSLSDISSQSNTTETTIAFEPLHTTDYFASQGIKLTDEPVTNDKLGSQLKSFTEWLKSMKKIHQEKLPEGDEQTDKNIQQIAENSNAEAEVLTEAMADVLIKQNKTGKAIEVYEKLSLINPSKSAYFAAKIDRLKTP
ncbi:MAG TPA: hypothetical protein VMY77_04435 [Chitinophagaceae bacterium]|nr:hypothetical protein [Chitinophagaceae bacterium]